MLLLIIVIVLAVFLWNKRKLKYSFSSSESVYIFYAPWCGHCKHSMPEFKQAEKMTDNVVLVNSEDPSNKDIMKKFSVQSFPTIVKEDGTAFVGERKAKDIVNFANK